MSSIIILLAFSVNIVLYVDATFSVKDYVVGKAKDYVERNANVEEDAVLEVPELIRKYKYPCEEHTVTTPDGYILTLHRIPHGRFNNGTNKFVKRPVAFLQHGVLASSASWIITGVTKGLAYVLAEEGYDVWMGNVRGNKYSRKHTYLKVDEWEFWDFSWHEMGMFDLPTMIDYILKKTGQRKLNYIGHSLGTTIFYVMCSELPDYNKKVNVQFSLAPVAYLGNMKSPLLNFLSYFKGVLSELFDLVGLNEFLPQSNFMTKFGDSICAADRSTQAICTNTLFILCGFNEKQLNTTLLPVILGHMPAGASTKQFVHYGQQVSSGEFRLWSYGIWTNLKRYGSFSPPSYVLRNVRVPVYLFHSVNDWLADEEDVLRLYGELGNPKANIVVPNLSFNHLDFIFGIDAKTLVYDTIIALMKAYNKHMDTPNSRPYEKDIDEDNNLVY